MIVTSKGTWLGKFFKTFLNNRTPGGQLLGRWDTKVTESIKNRRIDLANIDSCGDEICSNPQKLISLYATNKYYLTPISRNIKT
tara:strand:- start:302 stop:553 length:252 start_codon:yes stop_codon:yes gene_type:complete